jgi:hypothetical protein
MRIAHLWLVVDDRLVPRAVAIAHHLFEFVDIAGFHASH